jgi:transposase
MNTEPTAKEPIKIGEAAALAGVTRRTISNWIEKGLLTKFQIGKPDAKGRRPVRVDRAELEPLATQQQAS